MMRRIVTAAVVLISVPALAQEPMPPVLRGSDKLAALIQRVSQVQASIKTLTADFEQVRTSSLLAEPSRSRGRFYYKAPDSVRWDYDAPRNMTVLIAGGVALTYRPAEKRAERIEVGKAQRRVLRFLSAAEPLDKLTEYFSFTFIDAGGDADYILRLKPVTHMMKKRMRSVELAINRTTYLPGRVSYVEADGDSTVYTFSDIKVNAGQPADLYSLQLPADVQVVTIKLGHSE